MGTLEKKTLWSILVGVVILGGLLIYVFTGNRHPVQNGNTQPTYAPKGELVSGFPSNLLLDSSAPITQSYSMHYPSGAVQYTAEYQTARDAVSVIAGYQTHLGAMGWNVRINSAVQTKAIGLSGATSTASILVTAAQMPQGSDVTVSYTLNGASDASVAGSPLTIKSTDNLSTVPAPLTDLADWSHVHPYGIQTRQLADGGTQYLASWNTAHMPQNYQSLKTYLTAQTNYVLVRDSFDAAKGFSMHFTQGSTLLGVIATPMPKSGFFTITFSLYEPAHSLSSMP